MKSTSTLAGRRQKPLVAPKIAVERTLEVRGTTIRYLEAGAYNPGPPLVMLHGYRAAAEYWSPQPLPALAARHHVIAPDLPGFGLSGTMPSYGLGAYGEMIKAFIEALGVGQVNLLGHSMGGQIAISAAAKRPEQIHKLVLVSSAGLPRLEPHWQVPIKMLADASTWHFAMYPTMFRVQRRVRAGRECLHMLQREHVGSLLKLLTMPTLIVWGSRDRVVPLEHGALMTQHLPNARLHVIRGAGHMPFYQKPQEFNRVVLAFLSDRREGPTKSEDANA